MNISLQFIDVMILLCFFRSPSSIARDDKRACMFTSNADRTHTSSSSSSSHTQKKKKKKRDDHHHHRFLTLGKRRECYMCVRACLLPSSSSLRTSKFTLTMHRFTDIKKQKNKRRKSCHEDNRNESTYRCWCQTVRARSFKRNRQKRRKSVSRK